MHGRHGHRGFGHRGHGHGEGFGPFGASFGGPPRRGKLVTSEELQLIVLHLISEKPRHGYEIIKAVEDLSSAAYVPSPGMIYPALTYLEEVGHAVSEADGVKKLYRLTEAGTSFLAERRDEVASLVEGLKLYGQKMAHFQEQVSEEEMAEQGWIGTIKQKLEFHKLRKELKSVLFEHIVGASPQERARVVAILKKAIAEIRKK